ncbi:MAG: anti-sigma factor antagonist [Pseudomonadales bacterium]|nr:anti-sigma factor antagonist [Pseudomonadales bacterium]
MGKVLFAEQDGVQVLKFEGDVRVMLGPTITDYLKSLSAKKGIQAIIIDLRETTSIDSTTLGLLAKISIRSQQEFNALPTIISTNPDITRILESMGFNLIFVIAGDCEHGCEQLGELPTHMVSESALRDQVIDAHKVLMGLNEENMVTFRALVEALQKEKDAGPAQKSAGPRRTGTG